VFRLLCGYVVVEDNLMAQIECWLTGEWAKCTNQDPITILVGKVRGKEIVGIGWVEEVVTSQTTLSIAD
jgi:hypothetical protein